MDVFCVKRPRRPYATLGLPTTIRFNLQLYMKRLLILSSLISATAFVGAQSFEWNTSNPTPAAHPKEVQVEEVRTTPVAAEAPQQGTAGVYAPADQGKPTAYGETYRGDEMTGSHPALPLGTLLRVTNTENGRTVVVRVTDKGKECADCLITLSEVAANRLGIEGRGAVSLEKDGFSNWNPVPPAVVQEATPTTYRSVDVGSAPEQPATFNRYSVVRPANVADEAAEEVRPPAPTVTPDPQQREARGALPTATAVATASTPPAQAAYAVQLAAYNNETYALRRVEELRGQGVADVYYRTITKPSGEVINRVYAGTFVNVTDAQAAAREIQGKHNIAGIVAKM